MLTVKSGMNILVIDDEPAVADVIAEALRDEGNHVTVAGSGAEGLQMIAETPPDAVFLDIVMPGMDGIEVLRRIRAVYPDLPVIILSGWASPAQIASARRLGVTDVLQKPVALKTLSRALAQSHQS